MASVISNTIVSTGSTITIREAMRIGGSANPLTFLDWIYRNTVNAPNGPTLYTFQSQTTYTPPVTEPDPKYPYSFHNVYVTKTTYTAAVPPKEHPAYPGMGYPWGFQIFADLNPLATAGALDANLKLAGSYRTNYLGTYGAEIA